MAKHSSAFVMWGSSGHAKVLNEIIASKKYKILALFDNNKLGKSIIANVPLYHGIQGFKNWVLENQTKKILGAVAIGGNNGLDRHKIVKLFKKNGFETPSIIHPRAIVSPTSIIGSGSHILAGSNISADVVMGEACIINNQSNVDHECCLGNGVHIAPGAVLCGCVEVGDYSMIGAGAVVLPRIKIGKHCLVGAGSVVTKNIPDYSVAVGTPAKYKIQKI